MYDDSITFLTFGILIGIVLMSFILVLIIINPMSESLDKSLSLLSCEQLKEYNKLVDGSKHASKLVMERCV